MPVTVKLRTTASRSDYLITGDLLAPGTYSGVCALCKATEWDHSLLPAQLLLLLARRLRTSTC